MDIQIIRIYETADPSDGKRILVDRLWSREISKENAHRNIIWNNLTRLRSKALYGSWLYQPRFKSRLKY